MGQFVTKTSICLQVASARIGFNIQRFHDIEHARGGHRAHPAPASYPGSVADPSTYRPRTGDIPTSPGVYRFSDPQGRVIYVGKAKNLRNRLTNYFQDLANLHPRTQQMVTTASAVQWTVVRSEVEALTLEFTWIKEFNPRFNVMFKDDKSYPYLAVSMGERFPRVQVTRERKRAVSRYFGPYTQVWAIRETIDQLLRVFPMRSCSAGVFQRAKAQGRPCLLGYIDKCAAPCVGRISMEEHRELAEGLCQFMEGRTGPVIRDLEEQMRQASAELNFERAAKLRDDVKALRTVLERNAVVLDDGSDADVFSLVSDDLDAAVHVFHVRGGRIRGTRGWVIERVDGADGLEGRQGSGRQRGRCRAHAHIGDSARGARIRRARGEGDDCALAAGGARRVRVRARSQARSKGSAHGDGDRECPAGPGSAPHEAGGRHYGALEGTRTARREP